MVLRDLKNDQYESALYRPLVKTIWFFYDLMVNKQKKGIKKKEFIILKFYSKFDICSSRYGLASK